MPRPILLNLIALLTLFGVTCYGANESQEYIIPKDNGFVKDFKTRVQGDILTVIVKPESGYQITAKVNDPSPMGWVGGPTFICTVPKNVTGVHTGKFSGDYFKPSTSTGSGVTQIIKKWNGSAVTTTTAIVHKTVETPTSKDPQTRLKIGVCELVDFSLNPVPPGVITWTASVGIPLTFTGAQFNGWEAPEQPNKACVVTALVDGRQIGTVTFNVIPPESPMWKNLLGPAHNYNAGWAGAQMYIDQLTLSPNDVCFNRIQSAEQSGPPSNVRGYFANDPPFTVNPPAPAPSGKPPGKIYHEANGTHGQTFPAAWGARVFFTPKNVLAGGNDTAGYPPPGLPPGLIPGTPGFTAGGYDWVIPYGYISIIRKTGDPIPYGKVTQSFTISANGAMNVTKSDATICTISRTP